MTQCICPHCTLESRLGTNHVRFAAGRLHVFVFCNSWTPSGACVCVLTPLVWCSRLDLRCHPSSSVLDPMFRSCTPFVVVHACVESIGVNQHSQFLMFSKVVKFPSRFFTIRPFVSSISGFEKALGNPLCSVLFGWHPRDQHCSRFVRRVGRVNR